MTKYNFKIIPSFFLFMLFGSLQCYGQTGFSYDQREDVSSLRYNIKGFDISLSLVAMFTSGAADRDGVRLGAGIAVSQTFNNWKLTTGLDIYKAKQKIGLGTTFAGIIYDDSKYGGSYYLNKYWQGDKQLSGILGIHFRDFRISFEDDILALPFTSFVVYDRYRSAALEIEYKGFLLGTNVYTNEPNGLTEESFSNKRGVFSDSKQLSSPMYLGYTKNNIVFRYGINNKMGGYVGQNWWHEYFFNSCNFKWGGQNNQFFQIGINKQHSLY